MINEEQLISIAVEMDNLLYDPRQMGSYKETLFHNRTTVNLNPYYELNDDSWRLHIGANVDLSFKNGKSFYISPDIDLAYIFSDSYVLYARATGGRLLNDFRRLEQINPYACFSHPITDTYEQVNARIGFKTSPTATISMPEHKSVMLIRICSLSLPMLLIIIGMPTILTSIRKQSIITTPY